MTTPPGMLPVSAQELAEMRDAVSALGETSITITRKTTVQGPTGNVKPTYAPLATVTGNLATPSITMLQNYDSLVANLTAWQVRLPYGTDVQKTDRLVVGGMTLEVQDVMAPHSYSASVRLLATVVN